MSTAILFDQLPDSIGKGYLFKLKETIFSTDLEVLGNKINELYKPENCNTALVFDLTNAHPFRFKPARFFGLCSYYEDLFKKNGEKISIKIHLNEEQIDILGGADNLPRNVETVTNGEPVPLFKAETSLERKLSLSSIINIVRAKHLQLSYYFLISTMILFFILFLISFAFFKSTLLGLVLSFSSGILFFEAIIIIKALRKKYFTVK